MLYSHTTNHTELGFTSYVTGPYLGEPFWLFMDLVKRGDYMYGQVRSKENIDKVLRLVQLVE